MHQSTRAAGKKGGEWVFASHERSDPEEVLERARERACSGVDQGGATGKCGMSTYIYVWRMSVGDM